ncbi:hypothetical protein PENTCL1PPCAC_9858, partial [Pristionchus entomophagus]
SVQAASMTEDQPVCSICFDDLATKRDTTLKCTHRFHRTCILNWMETRTRISDQMCPNCRAPAELPREGRRKKMATEAFGKPQQPTLWHVFRIAQDHAKNERDGKRGVRLTKRESFVAAHKVLSKSTYEELGLVQDHLRAAV